ncbi:hypothetical protein CRENBAI_018990 [Crenichthys baileyi]|uniref:Immunoglobulin domain-containing protein n=1 Tax=Crenichthys baileyi TaxID=28760 RepID=A0AAV9RLH2_9TELE
MEIQHTLFFCFLTGASFLSNTAAPTYMQSAGLPIYTAMEGQSISFEFPFTLVGGGRRYLCKEECKLNNIIIETNTPEAQHGRYRLRYYEGLLQVTIKELKASDSGRYRCGVASSFRADSYEEMVEIRVNEAVNWSTTSSTRSKQQPSEETTPGNLKATTQNHYEDLDFSELTPQNPVTSTPQFQRASSTAIKDLKKTPGAPSTTASSVKQQTSQSAFLLAVGGCATVSSFSVVGFLILLNKWKKRTIANVLCDAKTLIQTEGGSITAKCSFAISGGGKFLCRHPCEDGDVLIKTEATEAQIGRYSIRYKEGTFPVSSTVLYVNISQLTKSDSGRYKCGLKRRFMIDAHQEFNIVVTDALNPPPDRPKQLDQQQTDEMGASKGPDLQT